MVRLQSLQIHQQLHQPFLRQMILTILQTVLHFQSVLILCHL